MPTNGFRDTLRLAVHFAAHGADFGCATIADYQFLADQFLSRIPGGDLLECVRHWNLEIVRYDVTTTEFGVLTASGHIKTYFTPDPAEHGEATNLDYFNGEC